MGKLSQKIQNKRKILKYYFSLLYKARRFEQLLDAINEVQKFGDHACFHDYPELKPVCHRFKQDCSCPSKTCPLVQINKEYFKAKKEFEDARVAHYQAETAMKSVKVQ